MASKSSGKDDKVMDVSRPGKGKIIINSRPLAAPVVNDSADSGDVLPQSDESSNTAPVLAPSAAKKVIQPINVQSESDEEAEVAVTSSEPEDTGQLSETDTPMTEEPADRADEPEMLGKDSTTGADQSASDDSGSEEEPSSSDSLPTPHADDSPIGPAAPATDQSGAASVDELAKAAEQKRLAAQKTKEETERDHKVQELINSKQYFVPIHHNSSSSKKMPLIVLLAVLILGVAGYLALDIGLFGKDMKLPYEFFKEDDRQAQDSSAITNSSQQSGSGAEQKQEEPAQADPGTTTPEDRAGDDEIKNELKNLQQKLETYFNDNNSYPETLAGLDPAPTTGEVQDDAGQAYTYTSNGQTYVLSAKLSDGTTYTLNSVNQ